MFLPSESCPQNLEESNKKLKNLVQNLVQGSPLNSPLFLIVEEDLQISEPHREFLERHMTSTHVSYISYSANRPKWTYFVSGFHAAIDVRHGLGCFTNIHFIHSGLLRRPEFFSFFFFISMQYSFFLFLFLFWVIFW